MAMYAGVIKGLSSFDVTPDSLIETLGEASKGFVMQASFDGVQQGLSV